MYGLPCVTLRSVTGALCLVPCALCLVPKLTGRSQNKNLFNRKFGFAQQIAYAMALNLFSGVCELGFFKATQISGKAANS